MSPRAIALQCSEKIAEHEPEHRPVSDYDEWFMRGTRAARKAVEVHAATLRNTDPLPECIRALRIALTHVGFMSGPLHPDYEIIESALKVATRKIP